MKIELNKRPDACKKHKPILIKLNGLEWYAEIDRRQRLRQKQKQCKTCLRWFFKDEI